MITDFQDRSNARARKRVCKNHLFSYWGRKPFGGYWEQYVQGRKLNQKCEELMDEKEELANIKQEEENQSWENH